MSYPLEGPLPLIDLISGATIVIEAVNPATGVADAGVVINSGVAYGDALDAPGADDASTLRVWLQPPGSVV